MKAWRIAGLALVAIFVIAIALPWNDYSNTLPTSSTVGVLVFLSIAVVTAMYMGGVAPLTILSSGAFGAAAITAYVLGNAVDYQMGWRDVGWRSYEDSGRLFGYNWGDLIGRLFICLVFAAPIGAAFGALGWAIVRIGRRVRKAA